MIIAYIIFCIIVFATISIGSGYIFFMLFMERRKNKRTIDKAAQERKQALKDGAFL